MEGNVPRFHAHLERFLEPVEIEGESCGQLSWQAANRTTDGNPPIIRPDLRSLDG